MPVPGVEAVAQPLLFDAAQIEAIVRQLIAPRGDQSNGDEPAPDESSDDPADDSSSKKKRRGHGRRPLPPHLPRERRCHELSDEERRSPCCGELRAEIGAETSEQLEYMPASYKVIEHVRVKYACRTCEEHVALAAKPPQPVEKGLFADPSARRAELESLLPDRWLAAHPDRRCHIDDLRRQERRRRQPLRPRRKPR